MTTKVAEFTTIDRLTEYFSISFLYSGDFTGNGLEDVLVVGRITGHPPYTANPQDYPRYMINIVAQTSDGVFRLATSDLIAAGEERIWGTEPSVVIADFNQDGVDDIFIAGGTDTDLRVPSYFYLSNSSGQFDRQEIATNKWIHGITSFDVDGDGVPEIFTAGFDPVHHYLKFENGQFSVRNLIGEDGNGIWGGSAIAVGRFSGDGRLQAVRTDDGGHLGTRMYQLAEDESGNMVFTPTAILPPGRFELPKWDHLDILEGEGFRSHDVKVFARDLDGDGLDDLVVLSWPWLDSNRQWRELSEVQFLMNKGNGVFEDETELRLVGFDNALAPSHFLKFVDLNRDGHIDIYLDGHAFGAPYSKRFLLNDGNGSFHQADNTSLAAWSDMLNGYRVGEYAPDAKSTPMTVVQGADGNLYLAAMIYPYDGRENGWRQQWEGELYVRPLTADLLVSDSFPGAIRAFNSIDGGDGVDTAIFTGSSSEYSISLNASANTVVVTDRQLSRDGVDTLINVERLKFADKTLALDIDGNAGDAFRLYKAAFNRIPDEAGLGYWIREFDNGMTLAQASNSFIISEEFQSLYGAGLTNQAFLEKIYQNVLGRGYDQAGFNYWLGELESGVMIRDWVLAAFSESAENKANVIGQISNGFEYIEYLI